jgi:hypothetical protein
MEARRPLRVDVFKVFQELLLEPREGGASLGVKQVARTATVVIRSTETQDGNSKLPSLLEEVGPVVFELLAGDGKPDLYWLRHLQQVIDVPMRSGG